MPNSNIQVIQTQYEMPGAEAEALKGTFLNESHYDCLITSDADVFKPNGELLLRYRKNAVPREVAINALPSLKKAVKFTDNRGIALGLPPKPTNANEARYSESEKVKQPRLKADGTASRQSVSHKNIESGIIGYFDRNVRFPYCRQTAYTKTQVERWENAVPYIQAVSRSFEHFLPERAHAQKHFVEQTAEDFLIPETLFTTVTVNRNWQTAVHADAGDLKQGFGVLTAFRSGLFSGCYFVFPTFRVAVDLQNFAVLLCDVHELHGNTAFRTQSNDYERISCVFYYRQNMKDCGTAAAELTRAKARQRGDKLYG